MKTKKYKEGVQVQVIRETQDPDFDFEIGGWSGKINDIAEDGGGWLCGLGQCHLGKNGGGFDNEM